MFWKKFPKYKPKKREWYQCTIEFGSDTYVQHYVMDLFWDDEYHNGEGRFIDNRRQNIFDSYHVYSLDPVIFKKDNDRLTTNHLCDRTAQVVAWRRLPKPYITKLYREIHEKMKKERTHYE